MEDMSAQQQAEKWMSTAARLEYDKKRYHNILYEIAVLLDIPVYTQDDGTAAFWPMRASLLNAVSALIKHVGQAEAELAETKAVWLDAETRAQYAEQKSMPGFSQNYVARKEGGK